MGIMIDYFRDVRRSGDPALLQREIELCRQSAGLCDYDKSSLVHCGTEESMLTEALDCLENPFQPILTFAKNFDLVDYGIYGLGLATASTIDEAIKFGCLGRKSGMTPCRLAVALQHTGNGLVGSILSRFRDLYVGSHPSKNFWDRHSWFQNWPAA